MLNSETTESSDHFDQNKTFQTSRPGNQILGNEGYRLERGDAVQSEA